MKKLKAYKTCDSCGEKEYGNFSKDTKLFCSNCVNNILWNTEEFKIVLKDVMIRNDWKFKEKRELSIDMCPHRGKENNVNLPFCNAIGNYPTVISSSKETLLWCSKRFTECHSYKKRYKFGGKWKHLFGEIMEICEEDGIDYYFAEQFMRELLTKYEIISHNWEIEKNNTGGNNVKKRENLYNQRQRSSYRSRSIFTT